MKKLSDLLFPDFQLHKALETKGNSYNHLGFYKPLQSIIARDDVDIWRSSSMNKQVIEELRKNNLLVEELDKAEKNLKIYHKLRFPVFLLGTLFGALVFNPTYIGKTSRLLRKLVPLLTGYAFFSAYNSAYIKKIYLIQMHLFENMPHQYKRWMETRDSRYLIVLNILDTKVNPYDSNAKRFLN